MMHINSWKISEAQAHEQAYCEYLDAKQEFEQATTDTSVSQPELDRLYQHYQYLAAQVGRA